MPKKILSVLLCLTMTFSVVVCYSSQVLADDSNFGFANSEYYVSILSKNKVLKFHNSTGVKGTIEFFSSNESIATVDHNMVYPKSVGICTITAKLENYIDTCTVNVHFDITDPETGELGLEIGESFTPKFIGISDLSEIQWSTTNKNVATVSNTGVIKAAGYGYCDIIAEYNGYKLEIPVEVNRPIAHTKKIVMHIGKKETVYLEDGFYGNRINKTLNWATTNKKIATVNKKGVITAKKLGSCYVKAKYKGKTYKIKIVVTRWKPNYLTWIDEYSTRNKWISVYIENAGVKNMTILSKEAKYIDYDFKECDRNLAINGKSKVVIKPGAGKTIKFKIKKGSFFWSPYSSKIRYYFTYDGKKYKAYAYEYCEEDDE